MLRHIRRVLMFFFMKISTLIYTQQWAAGRIAYNIFDVQDHHSLVKKDVPVFPMQNAT